MSDYAAPEMANPDRATNLIHEIGALVVGSETLRARDWAGVSAVAILGDGSAQMSAYSYDAAGKPTPGHLDRALFDKFDELRDAMRGPGKRPWLTALVQIKRADGSINIDFDYDDAMRWKVTPMNLLTMPEALRPK